MLCVKAGILCLEVCRILARTRPGPVPTEKPDPDAKQKNLDQLRALGYISDDTE